MSRDVVTVTVGGEQIAVPAAGAQPFVASKGRTQEIVFRGNAVVIDNVSLMP